MGGLKWLVGGCWCGWVAVGVGGWYTEWVRRVGEHGSPREIKRDSACSTAGL